MKRIIRTGISGVKTWNQRSSIERKRWDRLRICRKIQSYFHFGSICACKTNKSLQSDGIISPHRWKHMEVSDFLTCECDILVSLLMQTQGSWVAQLVSLGSGSQQLNACLLWGFLYTPSSLNPSSALLSLLPSPKYLQPSVSQKSYKKEAESPFLLRTNPRRRHTNRGPAMT